VTRDANDVHREQGEAGVRAMHDQARKFNGNPSKLHPTDAPPLAPVETSEGISLGGVLPAILSKAAFVKDFIPPEYLIDGILQRHFIYALTGQTGHGKTTVALLLAQLVGSTMSTTLAGRRVEKGRVGYFVGEHADEIRMRVIGADALRSDDPAADRISFIPGVFDVKGMFNALNEEIRKLGGLDLIIVDTSAAYFFGKDENSNTEMGEHAKALRKLTELEGKPCVLVLCHPVKNATEPSQLVPRGGGHFLTEIDGNLTVWMREEGLADLHHTPKLRGPGFEPITFKIIKFQTPALVDVNGNKIWTVRAEPLSETDEQAQVRSTRRDEDLVLAAMLKDSEQSMNDIARACNWVYAAGPAKSKVQRLFERMKKHKLADKTRDGWCLTNKGKDAARRAALKSMNTE
jgi:KaiC/GvpD/RAD55 family RecA-like ATPase/predicted transcriptional regulator